MAKFRYALERGGDKSLEISWGGRWINTEVRLNGILIGAIPNRKELAEGQLFQLPDGTSLKVQLVKSELRVLRNDKPLPGSSSDPATRLAQSYGIIYFIAGLNIVLGFIALMFQVEFLQTLGFGTISVAIGSIFLVLGYFTQRRSLIALIIALIIYSLDSALALFSGFNIALVRFNSEAAILSPVGNILMFTAPLIGFTIIRIAFLIGMWQGVGAINKFKEEAPPPVSWGRAVFAVIGLAFALIGLGFYAIYSSNTLLAAIFRKSQTTSILQPTRAALATSGNEAAYVPQDTARPTLTKRPTITPKPMPVEVDFTSIYNYPTDISMEVILVGQLLLPGRTHCEDECGVGLRNPHKYSEEIPVFIYIPLVGETPAPNMMARLPDQYRSEDFRVRLDNGKYVGIYATVRITGSLCETTDGEPAICKISKIEKETPK